MINVGRGTAIDTDALTEALYDGRIAELFAKNLERYFSGQALAQTVNLKTGYRE